MMEVTEGAKAKHLKLAMWARRVAVLLSGVLGLALAQQFYGLGLMERLPIMATSPKLFQDGKAFRYRLPDDYTTTLMAAKGQVLENGVLLLNRRLHANEVVDHGGGTYHFKPPHVRFSAPDDSDIRSNGRTYEVLAPKQLDEEVFYWLGGLLFLALGVAVSGGGAARLPLVAWLPRTGWVFAIALVVAVSHVFLHPDLSSGGLLVKGMPESDAGGWHEMAVDFAQGRGITTSWGSQRPFYSVLLGAAYGVFGHSVVVAKLLHAVILAVAAAMVVSFAGALRQRWAGVAVAAVLVWSEEHELMMHSILTENAGLLFAVLGVGALWVAGQRGGDEGRGLKAEILSWPMLQALVAGLLVGFGNLASGVLLVVVPVAPFILVAMALRGDRVALPVRAGLRRGVLTAAAFTLGVCLVFLPWMARQHAHYGVFTLSTNTGELLYGGADPVNGKLSGANFHLPEQAGIPMEDLGARMRFFMGKYTAQVASAPAAYVAQVLGAWGRVFHAAPLDSAVLRLGVLLLLLGAGASLSLRLGNMIPALVALGLMWGWLYVEPTATLPILLVGAGLCLGFARGFGERWLVGLVGLTLGCGTFLSALAGGVGVGRFWMVLDWALGLLVCLGACHAVALLSWAGLAGWKRLRGAVVVPEPVAVSRLEGVVVRAWQRAGLGLVAVSILALAMVMGRTWGGPVKMLPSFDSVLQAAPKEVQWAVQQHPDAAAHGLGAGAQVTLALDEGRAAYLAAGEDIGTFHANYQRRGYARWVVSPAILSPEGIRRGAQSMQCRTTVQTWQRLGQPALWVWVPGEGLNSITNALEPTCEVLAIIPLKRSLDGQHWEADREATRWMRGW